MSLRAKEIRTLTKLAERDGYPISLRYPSSPFASRFHATQVTGGPAEAENLEKSWVFS